MNEFGLSLTMTHHVLHIQITSYGSIFAVCYFGQDMQPVPSINIHAT